MSAPAIGTTPVVLVVSSMYPSACFPKYGSFVADAVRALEAEGVSVRLAVSGDARTGALRNALKYTALAGRAKLAAYRGGFDVIHAHYLYPPGAIAAVAALIARRPLVIFSHGSDVLLAGWRWPTGALTRWAVRRATVVCAPSEAHAEVVREVFGADVAVEVLPVGVDLEAFTPGDRAAARASLGLSSTAPIALFAGALDANKGAGLGDVLRSLAQPALAGLALVVLGEGPRGAELRDRAAELGVAGRVTFLPFADRESLVAYYRAADVVVVPSRRESLGLVALEAQAVGTPVVAARVGGLPEHVVPGVTGELYESGDVAALGESLARVLAHRDSYRPAVDRERFGLAATGRRLRELNERLVAGTR